MRSLQFTLHRGWSRTRQSKDTPVEWNEEIVLDLHWWKDISHLLQGRDLTPQAPDILLHTDASDLGWGATTANLSSSGLWSQEERDMSINLRELRAIRLGLLEFENEFAGRSVGILADNTTALSYLRKEGGTRSATLNAQAQDILAWAEQCNV